MVAKYERLTSIYLKLWKLIDIHFPGHHWLEITEESKGALKSEIHQTLEDGLSWAPEPQNLCEDINRTLKLVESKVETDWLFRAQELRTVMQDKALQAADQIHEDDLVFSM